jgi:hypothetical protein
MLSICKFSVYFCCMIQNKVSRLHFMNIPSSKLKGELGKIIKRNFRDLSFPISTAESAKLYSSLSNWISYVAKSLYSLFYYIYKHTNDCKDCGNLYFKYLWVLPWFEGSEKVIHPVQMQLVGNKIFISYHKLLVNRINPVKLQFLISSLKQFM